MGKDARAGFGVSGSRYGHKGNGGDRWGCRMQLDHNASFIHFAYPFLFNASEFNERVEAVACAHIEWQGHEHPVWEKQKFDDDDLLAHVASYLNPHEGTNTKPTADLWTLTSNLSELLGLEGRGDWTLKFGSKSIPFLIGEKDGSGFTFQLVLFHSGVGFLTVRVKPQTEQLDGWLDLLHAFRFSERREYISIPVASSPENKANPADHQDCSFWPQLPFVNSDRYLDGTLSETGNVYFSSILSALLHTADLSVDRTPGADPWWRDVFIRGKLIPFAALFIQDIDDEMIPELLYRVRNFFHSQQAGLPTPMDLSLDHPDLLAYAYHQWFTFSLDGQAFIACNPPQQNYFFTNILPDRLAQQYFMYFLLAQYQRFTLMMLSDSVAKDWMATEDIEERSSAFERTRDSLLSFTARGHFTQVGQQERHHRYYSKLQDTLQVKQLAREVSEEVREMHDILQMKLEKESAARYKSLENWLAVIAVVLLVPSLMLGFAELYVNTSFSTTMIILLVSFAVCAVAIFTIFILRRVSTSRNRGEPRC